MQTYKCETLFALACSKAIAKIHKITPSVKAPFTRKYRTRTLEKQGLIHVRKESSQITVCSPCKDSSHISLCSPHVRKESSQITLCSPHVRKESSKITLCSPRVRKESSQITLCSPRKDSSHISLCSPHIFA